ncbi:MAG: hypothetical protein DHS20C05_02860 [Hyphococcus sp.]|nr:MAG: hypothetical protein DHS20C05_02860 [Marinicaulis sp.]
MPPVDANFSSDPSHAKGATRVLKDILGDLAAASARDADISADQEEPKIPAGEARLGDIIDRLDERAYGFLILLLALPCCLPFVYLLPQIVALPMLALAGQMAAGRQHPWLPAALHERKFSIAAFEKVITRSEKYVGFVERFARPRLLFITGRSGARIVGALMLIPAASILVPLPSTNTLPGIGTAVTSLGLVERDGVLVILGLLIGLIWVGLLVFLGAEAIHLIKGWLLGA